MTDKGRLALERHLQKAFRTLKSSSVSLDAALTSASPLASSIANFIEQLECVKVVDFCSLPFHTEFPDLKEKLLFKIEHEVVESAKRLTDVIDPLNEKYEEISKYCETSQNLLQKYSKSCDNLTEPSDTTPAITQMVSWLQHISELLWDQYNTKLYLLETLGTEEGVSSKDFVNLWREGEQELTDTIKVYLAYVQIFLEDKR